MGVLRALLSSPLIGFVLAPELLLAMKLVLHSKSLYEAPKCNAPPPMPILALLILTCTGVSFFHGSRAAAQSCNCECASGLQGL